jgi:hypothetical protein
MRQTWLKPIGGLFFAALLCSPVFGSGAMPPPAGTQLNTGVPKYPQPGVVNYVEGQAAIGGQSLDENSVGSVRLTPGQTLTTQSGKAEILLTPGIFLRAGDNSSVKMISAGLATTVLTVEKGRALVEVDQIYPDADLRINVGGTITHLQKPGLYDFDADQNQVRVFDGQALAQAGRKTYQIKGGHELAPNSKGQMKWKGFDKKAYEDELYRWSSLRSSYLAEANVDAARRYANSQNGGQNGGQYGGGYGAAYYGGYPYGPYGGFGFGFGYDPWMWDPWFDAYTFMPFDGMFYSPFGYGFYSPGFVGGAPYYGYGNYAHHFGAGYRPAVGAQAARAGHAYGMNGGGGFAGNGSRGINGGFRGTNGVRGGAMGVRGGGFHGGGGMGGGGFHGGGGMGGGGGFHGGGGGGGRR